MLSDTLSAEAQNEVRPHLLTLRMIVFALATGVVMFQAVVLFLKGPPAMQFSVDPLGMIAVFLAVMNAGLSFAAPMFLAAMQRKSPATSPVEAAQRIQMRTIVSCALLEGAAFLNLVVVLLQGSGLHLVVANGLLLLMMTRFPLLESEYHRKVAAEIA